LIHPTDEEESKIAENNSSNDHEMSFQSSDNEKLKQLEEQHKQQLMEQ
jgi:hypothetical protein